MDERIPPAVKETILGFGEWSMGVHRVVLVLRDGRLVEPVFIAWGDEVVTPTGFDPVEVDPADVVDALDRS